MAGGQGRSHQVRQDRPTPDVRERSSDDAKISGSALLFQVMLDRQGRPVAQPEVILHMGDCRQVMSYANSGESDERGDGEQETECTLLMRDCNT